MVTVRIEIPAFLAREIGHVGTGWSGIEREVTDGTTVLELLADLAAAHPEFRESVFNPDAGTLNEQIGVVLNDVLLTFDEVKRTTLVDEDIVTLLPIYSGG